MSGLPPLQIPAAADAVMRAEAERTYPEECCGICLWTAGDPSTLAVVPFENQQNRLHALDPAAHPRDARTAYNFDALKLQRTLEAAAAEDRTLAAIFHSHPEHGAYFSDTDRAAATPLGTPTFPEAAQIVYSVLEGRSDASAAFRWDTGAADFVQVAVEILEPPA
ncbi:MAG: M67 family metallopeptidase [Planctomycetota bacterium]|jgi:adenylyltransferase/sulfurtransferase